MNSLLKLLNRWWLVAFIMAVIIFLSFRGSYWSAQYTSEQNDHQLTKIELAQAIEQANHWMFAYAAAHNDALAQADSAQACLDRERQSQQAKKERDSLASKVVTRPLTPQEKNEIVDDHVRQEYIDRFNRPFWQRF